MIRDVFMRFPGGAAKVFTLSYDDGIVYDKPLVEMFNKYHVKGTFNLNSDGIVKAGENPNSGKRPRLNLHQLTELFEGTEHEIAVHTCNHPSLAAIPQASAVSQIVNDREMLEKMFGRIIRGMAYPNGTWAVDDKTVEAARCAGIVYARGTRSTHSFVLPIGDPLRLEPTCHHNDKEIFNLIDKFLEDPAGRFPLMFYVWGHSYEFNDKNNWDHMEAVLSKIANRDDVWYATNIEICDYVNAFKQLRFSVDMSMIHNPTATDLYFAHGDGIVQKIEAGQTLIR
jgi:hypothetical protein